MLNCPEYLETALAVNKVGAIFLPLNYRLAVPELEYILGHAEACGIVTELEFLSSADTLLTKVPSLRFTLVVGADHEDARSYEGAIESHLGSRVATVAVGPDDIQRLMYVWHDRETERRRTNSCQRPLEGFCPHRGIRNHIL